MSKLMDRWGRPLIANELKQEAAAATIGGVRSPISGYPADGLDPVRLAQILREADMGNPLRYLELAETIEERDLHYLGVLGTRKRTVSQIDITVEAGSDDPLDIEIADRVRAWLKRDELTDELFDILDAIGKGYSFTEIHWDTSTGQWQPDRLEWRDPRWFRPSQADLKTPMLIGEGGGEEPLPGGKFIYAAIKAKSGLDVRAGLARVAAWAWMFKAFTQRDWAIFTQTYGQPLRLGRWSPGASEADKSTLFRAVANIAGDCAAIIPHGMDIEFVESKSVGASIDLYERRADWLDRQSSKAVLGQTTSTDAVSGGHAVSKEHRKVQEDIERADAKALAGILNRDLIQIWVQLEYGPRENYPRLVIARPEAEDLAQLANSLGTLVPLGLRVPESEVRDRFGFSDPQEGDAILGAATPPPTTPDAAPSQSLQMAQPARPGVEQLLADNMAEAAQPAVMSMLDKIMGMMDAAGSLEELQELIAAAWPEIDTADLTAGLRNGFAVAQLAGRAVVAGEADDNT